MDFLYALQNDTLLISKLVLLMSCLESLITTQLKTPEFLETKTKKRV